MGRQGLFSQCDSNVWKMQNAIPHYLTPFIILHLCIKVDFNKWISKWVSLWMGFAWVAYLTIKINFTCPSKTNSQICGWEPHQHSHREPYKVKHTGGCSLLNVQHNTWNMTNIWEKHSLLLLQSFPTKQGVKSIRALELLPLCSSICYLGADS